MTFSSLHHRCLQFAIGLFCLSQSSFFATAWVSPSLGFKTAQRCTALYYSSEFDRNEISNSTESTMPSKRGIGIAQGISCPARIDDDKSRKSPQDATTNVTSTSIAEEATHNNDKKKTVKSVLPLKMTNDPADTFAATSPESLTLCQLLSGVDMAGAILPPELLGRIVSCHIEDKLDSLYDDDDDDDDEQETPSVFTPVLSPIEMKIWEYFQNQEAMMREQQLFSSEPKKDSFKAQMPQVTLDQLTLVPLVSDSEASWQCKLECALPEWKENIVVDVKADLLASLAYNYDPEASPLFTCVALALRYKAPIVLKDIKQDDDDDKTQQVWSTFDDLDRDFPQRTTLENLQQQSNRVTQNIEQGFEIHKLTGALQIAMRLGDLKAAEKIRAKLDEYDSMEDLPTVMDASDRMDDLENNMFQ
eukprot:CAMPEP_0116078902 /NCGR_PEP_ID=MMETSP0327-20121206/856_1 /TAXON_ID=44447 /ORGANISM="Pseudo-nitzschia delicatissima, Strain B596" /LENGTH=417 /DNA_ID=CAMNT_0003569491 /DNA_START=55 /DNA_END=1309 /DNA_ORIENTATION=-